MTRAFFKVGKVSDGEMIIMSCKVKAISVVLARGIASTVLRFRQIVLTVGSLRRKMPKGYTCRW